MKENEIIEGNKLIAEFMGAKYGKDVSFFMHGKDLWLPIHGVCTYTAIDVGSGKILQYHSSWDWLIPVIDKCTDLKEYSEYKELAYLGYGGIQINTKFITSTWESVVEFIKWYNQNKAK